MSKSNHTPGPWKVKFSQTTTCGICHKIKQDDDVECPVACLWEGGGTRGKSRQKANARLIAAAPELLKACKAQHVAIDRLAAMLAINLPEGFFLAESGQPWQAIQQGKAAIALAEKEKG